VRTIRIDVLPGVYPPSDDSYMLADAVNSAGPGRGRFLEIGCGSGIVAITAALGGWDVTAVDINPRAVECTVLNAEKNGVTLNAFVSDLFENVSGSYDAIAFNPPYLPGTADDPDYDPAWSGGRDGRAITDRFLRDLDSYLNPGGSVFIVQSSISGHGRTVKTLERLGYRVEVLAQRRFFFETLYVLGAVKPCP